MTIREQWVPLTLIAVVFLAFYFLPMSGAAVAGALSEALKLAQWYAREHVLLCLLPAFFIAGAISVFVSQKAVLRYLGPSANPVLAYSVASISGTILAVCSCTVLPLFAGIYRRGAGLGPATAFLYSGPAINVLAIILTARVLGWQLGVARAVGAIAFSVVIGLLMQLIFRREEQAKAAAAAAALADTEDGRPIQHTALFFAALVALLIFATWGGGSAGGFYAAVYAVKWYLTSAAGLALAATLAMWYGISVWKLTCIAAAVAIAALAVPGTPVLAFTVGVLGLAAVLATERGEGREWLEQSWGLAKQIMPLLLAGVLASGFLLGAPGGAGLIPPDWISAMVGGNGIGANLFASVAGALMYFATLTEVPILEGLIGNGMGQGPALALLLAGPALSLPSMLVIGGIMGWKRALTYIGLVVVMSTVSGYIFGLLVA